MNDSSQDIPLIILLGVPFHNVTMRQTLKQIDDMISSRTPSFIATANLDFAAQAHQDVELQKILIDANLVLCDGTPLVWASRLLNAPLKERVAGSDLMPHLAEHAQKNGYKLFFLGSSKEILDLAAEEYRKTYPDIKIVGTYAPEYAKLLDLDHDKICSIIKEAAPDILLVALGCPKQEKWIYMNYQHLNVPCSIGVGASLDFVAGKFKRAPVWMRKTGLEWVFRLAQEPGRLLGRYWFDFRFLISSLSQQIRLNHLKEKAIRQYAGQTSLELDPLRKIQWSGEVTAARIKNNDLPLHYDILPGHVIFLDLSEVSMIDSTGMGALLKLHKSVQAGKGRLALFKPSEIVMRNLELMKLTRFFTLCESLDEITFLIKNTESPTATARTEHQQTTRQLTITLTGDLVAQNAEEIFALIKRQYQSSEILKKLVIDMKEVRFMDSAGLGCLIKARKLTGASPTSPILLIRHAHENVLNVIRLAKLEKFLNTEEPV